MITDKNYYDLNNRGLSQSKIKDYIICPNMFYRKNISGELEKEEKKSWDVGTAIDSILTGEDSISNFLVLEPPKDVPEEKKKTYFMTNAGKEYKQQLIDSGKKIITESDYELIINVADAVDKTTAWKEIKKEYIFQEIFCIEEKVGNHFDYLTGKIDVYKIVEDTAYILDVKSTASLPINLMTGNVNKRKFYYSSLDYGYFIQMNYYKRLIQKKYPDVKNFVFLNFAVEKKEPFNTFLFYVANNDVSKYDAIIDQTIERIKNDNEFKKRDVTFDNAELLTLDNNSEDDSF
jgi:hypothetical protein